MGGEERGAAPEGSFAAAFRRFFRRRPRQERSRAAVDALLGALEEQANRIEDPEGWKLEELLRRAGVGVGSFYEYFSDREAIVGALVGKVTERNYRTLLETTDRSMCDSLEGTIAPVAAAVARTYFGRPRFTRLLISGIGRLGLSAAIVTNRDEFAGELARRAQRFFPNDSEASLAETMRMANDAVMGIVASELWRCEQPNVELWGERFTQLGCALLRARHGAPSAPEHPSVAG
jgi:AcrR family transcriptional regulator